jgi:hypothetical protein
MHVEPLVERVFESVAVRAEAPAGEPRIVITPAAVQLRLAGASTLVGGVDLSLVRLAVDPESLRGLERGEMRRVRVGIDGVPPLVTAVLSSDVVTARRADAPSGGGGL